MIRDIPAYVKAKGKYDRYSPDDHLLFMANEKNVVDEIGIRTNEPTYKPPTFKEPVRNAQIWHCEDGEYVLVAGNAHHFSNLSLFGLSKAATLKQFVDFKMYSKEAIPEVLLVFAIPTLDRILQTSLKQLLFYYCGLGIGYVNGTPESVLLFRSDDDNDTQCSMAFADFEASFIHRLLDYQWFELAKKYSQVSDCPLPEASAQSDWAHDPINAALFYEGLKWYEILRFRRLRNHIDYTIYSEPAPYEREYFPAEHMVERYFYRYLLGTSTWRTISPRDFLAFTKMAATLVYLLHEDPAKRIFAIGIWCGNSPPESTWTVERGMGNLQDWIQQPWEEPLGAPETFCCDEDGMLETMNDVDAFNSGVVNPSWMEHHYGDVALVFDQQPFEVRNQQLKKMREHLDNQALALLRHLDYDEREFSNADLWLLAGLIPQQGAGMDVGY